MKYNNPIISGFHPDPSICRVGEEYYLVTSSFEYFPGVPLFRSRNLVNWELQGYCLSRKSQIPLTNCPPSAGIYAPTIRYHEGFFFMTTTNIQGGGNLIVHTDDLGKGWSEPVYVPQEGIDPSLLFDEDGRVYFVSAGNDEEGHSATLLCEINPFTGEQYTKSRIINRGITGKCPEAPHIYKIHGLYYLVLAEGGTEYGHMVTIQRSKSPYGPYESCPRNPVLSHRDESFGIISCVGHGDLMEDANGNWWIVCLGTRTSSTSRGYVMLHHLGRETFLAPVTWDEEGWPVIGNNGRLSLEMEGPLPAPIEKVEKNFQDEFQSETLNKAYNFLRNPHMGQYQLCQKEKKLLLHGTEVTLSDQDSPTWLGIPQPDFDIQLTAQIYPGKIGKESRAGLTAYYNKDYYYAIYIAGAESGYDIGIRKHVHDIEVEEVGANISTVKSLYLQIKADRGNYYFLYSLDGETYHQIGQGVAAALATEGTMTMTFTGTYLAMFAENGSAGFGNFTCFCDTQRD